jgi:phospholipid/cholesterol/gamma-HCH transport system substrate-binding protein
MSENRFINAGVGALLLLGIVSTMFIAFFASASDWKDYQGYNLIAKFDESAGLRSRAPVRIAGVQIGEVVSVSLTENYQANVLIRIDSTDLMLATDTSANIYTEGLLGVRYIALSPGFDETLLKHNDSIEQTSSGFVLENLIGQVMVQAGLQDEVTDETR